MLLKELLEEVEYQCVKGTTEIEAEHLVYHTGKIKEGCIFVCLKGANFDSHQAISEIAAKGAAAVIVERDVEVKEDLNVIKVEDSRKTLAYMSAAYFGHPARQMRMVAVTGTKGKTTTTYLIKSILENAGYKVGLVGTIETIIGDEHIPATNTTPESYILQSYLKQMLDTGCQAVIMEASSQGFKLSRTDAIRFDYGVFTNIEPDHIGPNEHADFEEYLQCKSMLFRQCEIGIVNGDDPHIEKVLMGHTSQIERYGIKNAADLIAKDIELVSELDYLGVAFRTEGMIELEVTVDTPGMFSVYNALAAIVVSSHFNIDRNDIVRALREAKVKGRIEMVSVSNEFSLMIDYAHNAMALESLLMTLKEYQPKRIVTLFGCGGNRSKMRRYEMGEVSGRLSDLTIITSDNPRDEEPMDIIADIRAGIEKTNGAYLEICDRREAIAYAINHACPGDVIILAGKGHEDYQEIKGVKYPMDEREIIQNITLQSDF